MKRRNKVALTAAGLLVAIGSSFVVAQPYQIPLVMLDSTGYKIQGNSVLNLLSLQSSPILSPETQNTASPDASYSPRPFVVGYNETVGNSIYESMITSNLTVTGTQTNHYGMQENTLNLLGSGTMNGELNIRKDYFDVPSTLTIGGSGEADEVQFSNNGTINSVMSGYTAGMINQIGGFFNTAISFSASAANYGSTNQYGTWIGFSCSAPGGNLINHHQCVYNQDPAGLITNQGHYGARPDGGAPVISACGTSPSLSSRGSDPSGIITEGSSATGCVLTFHTAYQAAPTCIISSPTGSAFTSYTTSTTALTIVNSSASGNQYAYICMDGY